MQQLVGPAKAFELAVLGERIDAAEALRIGLVNQVVPDQELDATVAALARRLAQGPTLGIGLTKRVLNRSLTSTLAEALAYEALTQQIASRSEDYREGVSAFLEKRPPQFKGR